MLTTSSRHSECLALEEDLLTGVWLFDFIILVGRCCAVDWLSSKWSEAGLKDDSGFSIFFKDLLDLAEADGVVMHSCPAPGGISS